ncbi:hypothetical protein PENSPDRAFT_259534 [Peniophora sp. CONT]|nr:hypothetical protein PENSPDRAFT_259534 [Peniophora sp. CONT]
MRAACYTRLLFATTTMDQHSANDVRHAGPVTGTVSTAGHSGHQPTKLSQSSSLSNEDSAAILRLLEKQLREHKEKLMALTAAIEADSQARLESIKATSMKLERLETYYRNKPPFKLDICIEDIIKAAFLEEDMRSAGASAHAPDSQTGISLGSE